MLQADATARIDVTAPCDTPGMGKGGEESVRSAEMSDGGTPGGEDVLAWLSSDEASDFALRRLVRSGFGRDPALTEDVISDAVVAVLLRMRSETALAPENPAAYGTTVISNVVKRLAGGDTVYLEDLDDHEAPAEFSFDQVLSDGALSDGALSEGDLSDELRMLLERRDVPAWLTSAALAYLCFTMAPDALPESAPAPAAGARPDQAMGWPALWFAGERDLFPRPGATDKRRTRARRIERVKHHVAEVFAHLRANREHRDG